MKARIHWEPDDINEMFWTDILFTALQISTGFWIFGFSPVPLFFTFNAYLSLNVPDTDLEAALYEIKPNETSIFLAFTVMRARCRNSISRPEPVKPGKINLYRFDTFDFFSRRLSKGSRLRLVFGPVKNAFFEKNYNSGGVVAEETAKDARKAVITLYHDKKHPSSLILPIYKTTKNTRDKKF